ncbi:GNAT family N-acetyltransferase [Aliivibrio sifiae]|uniref:N-acetyltransferase domain-containing protein n=2 Tax=Aliivibrio sifiae TaxID=566293 RepID=A0A2S7X7T6_9GAMM|nr:GNAT family N-acetyltransferase [Aliivibrio sifiae]PQJ87424.1 hypothetical protein BTO23_15030 [Aliivibrio sifiae]
MINSSKLKSIAFTTTRLEVANVDSCLVSGLMKPQLLSEIVSLLSPSVVESLPPYFHDINTELDAEVWLLKMVAESHLFSVKRKGLEPIIGFVFLYESDNATAHLGYLLAESSWHQGYGSELLFGLLKNCRDNQLVEKIIGGVDIGNVVSAKLLEKVGFVATQEGGNGVIFYECMLS